MIDEEFKRRKVEDALRAAEQNTYSASLTDMTEVQLAEELKKIKSAQFDAEIARLTEEKAKL